MTRHLPFPSAWARALGALAAGLGLAAVLASCGGDVGTGGTGAPASSYTSGRISGFGSVIVNGVRYDTTATVVVDDDGQLRSVADLQLGMTVAIDGDAIVTDATGTHSTARHLRFGPDIAGAVDTVTTASSTFTVLGQTVQVDGATVYGGYSTGLAGVLPGDLVAVSAFYDVATARYKATRIDKVDALSAFTLQGPLAAVDAGTHRLTIGAAVIDDSGVSSLPSLSVGQVVRVTLQTTASGGVWTATRVVAVQAHVPAQDEQGEVEGLVADFASLASFTVDGVPVDASGASVVFVNGTSAAVVDGARVEVEGTSRNGVLVATKVDVRQDDGLESEVELHGAIASADAASKTFVLRGQTVTWSASTVFSGMTSAGLVAGARVQVHGHLNATGDAVVATEIEPDN